MGGGLYIISKCTVSLYLISVGFLTNQSKVGENENVLLGVENSSEKS